MIKNDLRSPDSYYNHVTSNHPLERHEISVMDPMLGNPNSKFNIAALTTELHRTARIKQEIPSLPIINDNLERSNSRQWTGIAADAAIALQVVTNMKQIFYSPSSLGYSINKFGKD